jgi:hypothetical protein
METWDFDEQGVADNYVVNGIIIFGKLTLPFVLVRSLCVDENNLKC